MGLTNIETAIRNRDEKIKRLQAEIDTLKTEFLPFLEMLIADWTFRNDETGIDQPDSPELASAKELFKRLRGK